METLIGFLAALFVGILAGMGVGSGGVFLLYLTLIAGMEHKAAQGVNLLFFVFALAAAVPVHLVRYKVPVRILGIILLLGVPGALIGSFLVPYLPVTFLRKTFGVLLVFSGMITLLSKDTKKERKGKKKGSDCLTNGKETDIIE